MGEDKIAAAKEANQTVTQALAAAEKATAAAKKAQAAAEAAAEEQSTLLAAAKAAAEKAENENFEYKNMDEKITASKCDNNPTCAAANLTGYCCPTLNGISLNGTMLGCCGVVASNTVTVLP